MRFKKLSLVKLMLIASITLTSSANSSLRFISSSLIMPALHTAAHRNAIPEMIKYIKEGCDIDATEPYGQTALFVAAYRNNMAAARFLLASGAKVNIIDSDGRTALTEAAERGHLRMIGLLTIYGANWVNPTRNDS